MKGKYLFKAEKNAAQNGYFFLVPHGLIVASDCITENANSKRLRYKNEKQFFR